MKRTRALNVCLTASVSGHASYNARVSSLAVNDNALRWFAR